MHIDNLALDIAVVYKPGYTNYKNFLEEYESQLNCRKRSILFGDFNMDLIKPNHATEHYKTMLESNGYIILNKVDEKYCTRETDLTKTTLDHICTNLRDNTFHLAITDTALSDHKIMSLEMKVNIPKLKTRTKYQAVDYHKLQKRVANIPPEGNNTNYNYLENYIKANISVCKTTKIKIMNLPQEDWINRDILKGIAKRNQLWRNLKKNKTCNTLRSAFIQERNRVTITIKKAKKKYYCAAFKKCKNKPKKIWNLINTLTSNKIKHVCAPSKIICNNETITDIDEICAHFNQFFSSVGSELANLIPQSFHPNPHKINYTQTAAISRTYPIQLSTVLNTSLNPTSKSSTHTPQTTASHLPVTTHTPSNLHAPPSSTHVGNTTQKTNLSPKEVLSILKPCTQIEVMKIIDDLDTNVSTGVDEISVKSIQCIKHIIIEGLTNCINKSLEQGFFPDKLKIARVTPIYKSGSKADPTNYRPISVLPIISKIYEKVIYKRLNDYLTSINFLFERQYGFRPKTNTLSACTDLITKLKQHVDKGNIALGMFIDLKKAFDTVSHCILLSKLKSIGISGTAYNVFQSYLNNRYQVVKIGDSTSGLKQITYGVPQGSILGPLLFLIYINDMHKIGLHGHIALYADDTCLFYFASSIHDIIIQAQADLDTLNTWFQYNLLTINAKKTHYIIFATKNRKIDMHSPLLINGQVISQIDSLSYLGLMLESDLSWRAHIKHVKSKITPLTGALKRIISFLPLQTRQNIYNSLVYPHIEYLAAVWGSASTSVLHELQVAQNKVIKVLFNYDYLTPTETLYRQTKLMNIKQIYKYSTCILIRKIIKNEIHSQTTFIRNNEVHAYFTRNARNLRIPPPRTNYGKTNVAFEGAQIYNSLPNEIKDIESFDMFKKALKAYFINNS